MGVLGEVKILMEELENKGKKLALAWVSLTMNSVQFLENNRFRLKRNYSWQKTPKQTKKL